MNNSHGTSGTKMIVNLAGQKARLMTVDLYNDNGTLQKEEEERKVGQHLVPWHWFPCHLSKSILRNRRAIPAGKWPNTYTIQQMIRAYGSMSQKVEDAKDRKRERRTQWEKKVFSLTTVASFPIHLRTNGAETVCLTSGLGDALWNTSITHISAK